MISSLVCGSILCLIKRNCGAVRDPVAMATILDGALDREAPNIKQLFCRNCNLAHVNIYWFKTRASHCFSFTVKIFGYNFCSIFSFIFWEKQKWKSVRQEEVNGRNWLVILDIDWYVDVCVSGHQLDPYMTNKGMAAAIKVKVGGKVDATLKGWVTLRPPCFALNSWRLAPATNHSRVYLCDWQLAILITRPLACIFGRHSWIPVSYSWYW